MADSPNSTLLTKFQQDVSRRSFFFKSAKAATSIAALMVPTIAAAKPKYETDDYWPDDYLPARFREVRKIVQGFEDEGCDVLLCDAGIMITEPDGTGYVPLTLWSRFNALDRKLLADYLRTSGRIQPFPF